MNKFISIVKKTPKAISSSINGLHKGVMSIAVALIVFAISSLIFSDSVDARELKRLSVELQKTTDSLVKVKTSYETLLTKYDETYKQLESVQNNLKSFQNDISTILNGQGKDVYTIQNKLKEAIKTSESKHQAIDTTPTDLLKL